MTDEGLAALQQLTGLSTVSISWCREVTAAGLEALRPLTGLRPVLTCQRAGK